MKKPIIRRRIFIGDSLSDRGTLDHAKLLNIIPMSLFSGLVGKSPLGRFTNGLPWTDQLAVAGIEQLEIDHWRHVFKLRDNPVDNAELSDLLLSTVRMEQVNQKAFTLDDDTAVLYRGQRYVRSYCEGGATAYDWRGTFTTSMSHEASRLILSNLDEKRKQLLADDHKYRISDIEKAETLVTEWSGANDLITVNEKPNKDAADKAVASRIANLEALIAQGYKNFVLMNLPDLGLTPRYQAKSEEERKNATECSVYFNEQLAKKVLELKQRYQHKTDLFVDVFDVCGLLTEVYNDPEKYGFDKDKLKTPYTSTEEFKLNEANPTDQALEISPGKRYMFWDDVHPTADMHAWLKEKYEEKYAADFCYKSPTTCDHSVANKKELRQVKESYDLDVDARLEHRKHGERDMSWIPSKHEKTIQHLLGELTTHATLLESGCTTLAKKKAGALQQLLTKIDKVWNTKHQDIDELYAVLNAEADNPILAIHQNPRWDRFWKKEWTHTQEKLRELQMEIGLALNTAHRLKLN